MDQARVQAESRKPAHLRKRAMELCAGEQQYLTGPAGESGLPAIVLLTGDLRIAGLERGLAILPADLEAPAAGDPLVVVEDLRVVADRPVEPIRVENEGLLGGQIVQCGPD